MRKIICATSGIILHYEKLFPHYKIWRMKKLWKENFVSDDIYFQIKCDTD